MKIIITGASGFLGQNLMHYLKSKGHIDLVLLDRNALKSTEPLKGILDSDVIIHLAGKAHDLQNVSEPKEYYDVNYGITQNLYDAFLQSNAKKFIFISSVKAVADNVDHVLNEDDIPNPQTHYGKSKLKAEQYITSNSSEENGKFFFILRPCMIHGPGNKGNLNLLYQFVKMGIPYPLAAFDNRRSFLSVENLCFIITEIIERADIPEGVYQVADDDPLSTNEVVKIIAQTINKPARLWPIPQKWMSLAANLGSRLKLPLNNESLKKLTENYFVSNAKITSFIAKPLPLSSIAGLKKTIQSFNKS